jgi:hypothetical protein
MWREPDTPAILPLPTSNPIRRLTSIWRSSAADATTLTAEPPSDSRRLAADVRAPAGAPTDTGAPHDV